MNRIVIVQISYFLSSFSVKWPKEKLKSSPSFNFLSSTSSFFFFFTKQNVSFNFDTRNCAKWTTAHSHSLGLGAWPRADSPSSRPFNLHVIISWFSIDFLTVHIDKYNLTSSYVVIANFKSWYLNLQLVRKESMLISNISGFCYCYKLRELNTSICKNKIICDFDSSK